MKPLIISIKILISFLLITGVFYPYIVTQVANLLFKDKAEGQITFKNERAIGSAILAQNFQSPKYFWPRPSAAAYAGEASAGSNLSPNSISLNKVIKERGERFGDQLNLIPKDLLTASASGLDPHISTKAALYQVNRISRTRGISESEIISLIDKVKEDKQFSFLGKSRVNVLRLNLELDKIGK